MSYKRLKVLSSEIFVHLPVPLRSAHQRATSWSRRRSAARPVWKPSQGRTATMTNILYYLVTPQNCKPQNLVGFITLLAVMFTTFQPLLIDPVTLMVSQHEPSLVPTSMGPQGLFIKATRLKWPTCSQVTSIELGTLFAETIVLGWVGSVLHRVISFCWLMVKNLRVMFRL